MASPRTITVQLPGPVYKRVQQRAGPDFAEAVEGLAVLDDAALWRAARLRIPEEASARLEQLRWKRQSLELDTQESEELARLVHLSERTMLVRAEAARLLHQRGHEVLPTLLGE